MYFETLSDAVDAGIKRFQIEGAEFDEAEARRPFDYDGIPYPQPGATSLPYKDSNFQFDKWKGRGTRKYGHITIWRHESGRYEMNSYVL